MTIFGIDVGGSGIKGALVDVHKGELVSERERIPTPQPATPKAIAAQIEALRTHFRWEGPIGIGFPAVVQNGVVKTASNIAPQWIGANAEALFRESTGCKTTVLNDADAAGLAEVRFGAAKDYQGTVIVITVGTGLGAAIFHHQQLFPNTELGHLLLNGDIAEHFCSDAVRKRENLSWKKWGKRFNRYLLELERLFWPELVIIGGGASKKFDKFSEMLTLTCPVIPALLQNNAGIIGAALAAASCK